MYDWSRVDNSIAEARAQLENASIVEQFQAIGILCRESLISAAQTVYIPERHPSLDSVLPSKTDAKRMIRAFFTAELAGGSHKAVRRYANATLNLANELQHKRNATFKDTALCVEATDALVTMINIVSEGSSRASLPSIQVNFSYKMIESNHDEHLYQLHITLTNPGMRAIGAFKLEFAFPDLESIPRKWMSSNSFRKPTGPLVEIMPTDSAVSVSRSNYFFTVSYRSKDLLLPHDMIDVGSIICLRYRFTHDIYANLEDIPSISWKIYSDNMLPKDGQVSLQELNNF